VLPKHGSNDEATDDPSSRKLRGRRNVVKTPAPTGSPQRLRRFTTEHNSGASAAGFRCPRPGSGQRKDCVFRRCRHDGRADRGASVWDVAAGIRVLLAHARARQLDLQVHHEQLARPNALGCHWSDRPDWSDAADDRRQQGRTVAKI